MLKSDLKGNKAALLKACYNAIRQAEDHLIYQAIPKGFLNIEETCDIPQRISSLSISFSSIGDSLTVNNKLCVDYDNF